MDLLTLIESATSTYLANEYPLITEPATAALADRIHTLYLAILAEARETNQSKRASLLGLIPGVVNDYVRRDHRQPDSSTPATAPTSAANHEQHYRLDVLEEGQPKNPSPYYSLYVSSPIQNLNPTGYITLVPPRSWPT